MFLRSFYIATEAGHYSSPVNQNLLGIGILLMYVFKSDPGDSQPGLRTTVWEGRRTGRLRYLEVRDEEKMTGINCVYLIFSYSLWAYFLAVGKSWPND